MRVVGGDADTVNGKGDSRQGIVQALLEGKNTSIGHEQPKPLCKSIDINIHPARHSKNMVWGRTILVSFHPL